MSKKYDFFLIAETKTVRYGDEVVDVDWVMARPINLTDT